MQPVSPRGGARIPDLYVSLIFLLEYFWYFRSSHNHEDGQHRTGFKQFLYLYSIYVPQESQTPWPSWLWSSGAAPCWCLTSPAWSLEQCILSATSSRPSSFLELRSMNWSAVLFGHWFLFFQDVALIAAICGFLSSCVLLSHIFPTFLIMSLPRPTNTNVTSLPSSPNSSDNPPGYDTLMASQLPGYDDSIVQKTNLPVQVVLFRGMVNNMKYLSYRFHGVIERRKRMIVLPSR